MKLTNKFDINKTKVPGTSMTFGTMIYKEANRLRGLIVQEIDAYYNSYEPVLYKRTRAMRDSVEVANNITIDTTGMRLTIDLNLTERAWHESYYSEGSVIPLILLSYGWHTHGSFKDIYRFGYFEGANILQNAVDKFNDSSKYGVTAEIKRIDYR